MDRFVVLVVGQEEYCLGKVSDVLSSHKQTDLIMVIQGIVENMVFSDDGSDYTVLSIEVR
jgi:hypothetical protein